MIKPQNQLKIQDQKFKFWLISISISEKMRPVVQSYKEDFTTATENAFSVSWEAL
jgi:hypothetical protein